MYTSVLLPASNQFRHAWDKPLFSSFSLLTLIALWLIALPTLGQWKYNQKLNRASWYRPTDDEKLKMHYDGSGNDWGAITRMRTASHNPLIRDCDPHIVGSDRLYLGNCKGKLLFGKCTIRYANYIFRGTIKPFNLDELFDSTDGEGKPLYHVYIPANYIEVIDGQLLTCDQKVVATLSPGTLSKVSPVPLYTYVRTSIIPLLTKTDVEGIRIINSQILVGSIIQLNYGIDQKQGAQKLLAKLGEVTGKKEAGSSVKTKWLAKFNELAGNNDPYEIATDDGFNMILVPLSQRDQYKTYLTDLETDYQTAAQLAQKQEEAFTEKKRIEFREAAIAHTQSSQAMFELFEQQMALRTRATQYATVNRQSLNYQIPQLQFADQVSQKGYPYYGQVTLKLIDESSREIGSYQYTYDRKAPASAFDYYNPPARDELKATVSTTAYANHYDVYCDGRKVSTVKFVRQQDNTHHQGSFGMNLLMSAAGAVFDNVRVSGYESQLLDEAQFKVCFYKGDSRTQTKGNGKERFAQALASLKAQHYAETIELLDAAIYSDPQPEYYVARGDVFARFNLIREAFRDYLNVTNTPAVASAQLAETYRKMAALLAKIVTPTPIRIDDYEVSQAYAPVYLKKAAQSGDPIARKLLNETNSPATYMERLRNLY